MAKLSETSRFGRFLLSGGFAAAVNIAVRWVLGHVASYEASVACAYLVGMVTAFALARLFVFEPAEGSRRGQFTRFAMVNAAAFAQVWLVSVGLARLVLPAIGFSRDPQALAHVVGVLSPAVTSYILHKRFSFRGTGR